MGCGYEVFLPGAHSDIGGSYVDGKPNSYSILGDPVLKEWFYQQGIFTKENLIFRKSSPKAVGPGAEVALKREKLSNAAYKISLKSMKMMTEKFGALVFNNTYFEKHNKHEGMVGQLLSQIPKNVLAQVKWNGSPINFSNLYSSLPQFKNKYVHWSAAYEIGYHLRRGKNTKGMSDSTVMTRNISGLDKQEIPYRVIHSG